MRVRRVKLQRNHKIGHSEHELHVSLGDVTRSRFYSTV